MLLCISTYSFANPRVLQLLIDSEKYDKMVNNGHQLALKNASFEYCVQRGEHVRTYTKANLMFFLSDCISYAGANFIKDQDPEMCYKVARLATLESEFSSLKEKCRDEIGYYLCRKKAQDFQSRLNCASDLNYPIPVKECPQEVKSLNELRKKQKSKTKLTRQQAEVFKNGFCDQPSIPIPPSNDDGKPGQI